MKTTIFFLLTFLLLNCSGQEVIKQDFYDNGNLHIEHIKHKNSDTIIEKSYFENGQLSTLYHLVKGKRNGKSLLYFENGDLVFEQYYTNGMLDGIFKCFYPDGKILRIEYFNLNNNIDTSTFYDEVGKIIKKIYYHNPCPYGSQECNQTVTEYKNGIKVYSYEVKKGWKSDNHKIYNQDLYNEIKKTENKISATEQGSTLFKKNCAMCHGIKEPIVGPAIKTAMNNKTKKQLKGTLLNSSKHPNVKLSDKDIESLFIYLESLK